MSKAHRGKGIRDQVAHGRGECPVCKRYNVKILYEQEADSQKFKICKICKAAIKNGTKNLPVVEKPKVEEAPAVEPVAVETPAAEPAAAEAPAEDAAEN
ncbi:MAG: hypothetical protein LBU88_05760 [Treponema sp.]|jgi:hypothetical protein|nr:hypothetical protein [Treponema sp.]